MKMKKAIIFLFLLASSSALFAQGGSNYSAFGIGQVETLYNSMYSGMSGTSVAMPLAEGINLNNPAMWSYNVHTKMQLGYKFNQNYISDNNEIATAQFNGKLDGLQMIMALDTSSGFALGFGLYANSNISYQVANSISSVSDDGFQANGTLTKTGSGGLSTAYFGLSYQLFDALSFGASANVNFGKINVENDPVFEELNAFGSKSTFEDKFIGSFYKIGMAYEYEDFMIAGFYETKANMEVTRISNHFLSRNTKRLIPDTTISEFDVPQKIGFGVSYKIGKYRIGADYISQDFTDLQYNKNEFVDFGNNNTISIGVNKTADKGYSSSMLKRTNLFAGLGYKQSYLNISGQNINEYFASFGFSLPITRNTFFDASVVVGQRGNTDNGLVKEQFAKFNFNIGIGENWFKPYKFEYEED